MEIWQSLLKRGNQSFDHESWSQAEEYYHQAVQCIEHEWQEKSENMALILGWVGAFHNLAVLYETQHKPQLALKYLQIPYQRMVEITQQNKHSDMMQTIAFYLLKTTLAPLLAFSKKYPACDTCIASLKRSEAAINLAQPVLH